VTNRTVVLRAGVSIGDPVGAVHGLVKTLWAYDAAASSAPASFGEPDLRFANRGGARIAATQIAAILERQRGIERALRAIPPDAQLAARSVPWAQLEQLFVSFAGIRGVGLSKMTKALHPKRRALVPILDSVIQSYLHDDDLGADAPFEDRALALVRGYRRDVQLNRAALQATRRELARSGLALTEVRILDLLIWSALAA
jgi:hypothetical protein